METKNGVRPTVDLALLKDLILKTPEKSDQSDGSEKVTYGENYEDSQILFLESRAQSLPLQICLSFFTIYSGSNFW